MFTVILVRGRARRTFVQAGTLFEPFEEEKLVAFGDWNESPRARTAEDALPGIRALIRGKREWRVVVVDAPVQDGIDASQPDNPFDYLDNEAGSAAELEPAESSHALIRLTHMLLGFPPVGPKNFEAVYSYRDPGRLDGERDEIRARDLVGPGEAAPWPSEVRKKLTGMHDFKVHYEEVERTAEERARYDAVKEMYEFRGNRPTEVIIISPRRPPEADPHAQLRTAWSTNLGRVPSRFVARNGYPPGTRFAVYDLVDPEHSDHEHQLLRFGLSVLSVAVNHIPPSAFQADYLYQLGTEVDAAALVATLNTHLSRLGTVRDRIDAVLRNPARRPKIDLTALLVEQEIPVDFENLAGERVVASVDGYSLATDAPYSESSRWWRDYGDVVKRVEALLRKPRRVLAAAVYDARLKAQLLPATEIELSQFEREDLEDDLIRQAQLLAAPATADLLDRKSVRRMLERHHRAILQTIDTRLHSSTILVATAVALASWALGLLPYVIQAATQGAAAFGDALLVALLGLVVLLAGGVAALIIQRGRLLAGIRDLNRDLSALRSQVFGGAATFGRYLTDLSTYMRGRTLIQGSVVREEQERGRLQELQRVRLRIVGAMDFERSLIASLGATAVVQKLDGDLHTFDLTNRTRVRRLLQLPSPTGLTIPFNQSGEHIKAPYDFVVKLLLKRVPLFESAPPDDEHSTDSTPDPAAGEVTA
jgi:hypothetical protein